jgi:hypothetical protein
MVRTNTFSLKENQSMIDNIIVLTPRWYSRIMLNFVL